MIGKTTKRLSDGQPCSNANINQTVNKDIEALKKELYETNLKVDQNTKDIANPHIEKESGSIDNLASKEITTGILKSGLVSAAQVNTDNINKKNSDTLIIEHPYVDAKHINAESIDVTNLNATNATVSANMDFNNVRAKNIDTDVLDAAVVDVDDLRVLNKVSDLSVGNIKADDATLSTIKADNILASENINAAALNSDDVNATNANIDNIISKSINAVDANIDNAKIDTLISNSSKGSKTLTLNTTLPISDIIAFKIPFATGYYTIENEDFSISVYMNKNIIDNIRSTLWYQSTQAVVGTIQKVIFDGIDNNVWVFYKRQTKLRKDVKYSYMVMSEDDMDLTYLINHQPHKTITSTPTSIRYTSFMGEKENTTFDFIGNINMEDEALYRETQERIKADFELQTNIDNEVQARKEQNDGLYRYLNKETDDRKAADILLQTNIDNEVQARTDADNNIINGTTPIIKAKAGLVDTEGNVFATSDDAFMLYGSQGRDNIQKDSSLNDIKDCGQYNAGETLSNTIKDKPANEEGPFDLTVGYFNTDSTQPYQFYMGKKSGKIFKRFTADTGDYEEVWTELGSGGGGGGGGGGDQYALKTQLSDGSVTKVSKDATVLNKTGTITTTDEVDAKLDAKLDKTIYDSDLADIKDGTIQVGKSALASSLGDENITIKPENINEINFGGNGNKDTIYFGKSGTNIPSNYIFGHYGNARISANEVYQNGEQVANKVDLSNGSVITLGKKAKIKMYDDTFKDLAIEEDVIEAQLPVGSVLTIDDVSSTEAQKKLPKYGFWVLK